MVLSFGAAQLPAYQAMRLGIAKLDDDEKGSSRKTMTTESL